MYIIWYMYKIFDSESLDREFFHDGFKIFFHVAQRTQFPQHLNRKVDVTSNTSSLFIGFRLKKHEIAFNQYWLLRIQEWNVWKATTAQNFTKRRKCFLCITHTWQQNCKAGKCNIMIAFAIILRERIAVNY